MKSHLLAFLGAMMLLVGWILWLTFAAGGADGPSDAAEENPDGTMQVALHGERTIASESVVAEDIVLATTIRQGVERVARDIAIDVRVFRVGTPRLAIVLLTALSPAFLSSRAVPTGMVEELGLAAPPCGVDRGMSIHLATAKRALGEGDSQDLVLVVHLPPERWEAFLVRLRELVPVLLNG